jgi:hypothetical protein
LRILPGSARSPGFPPGSLGRDLVVPVLRFLVTFAFFATLVGKIPISFLIVNNLLLAVAFNDVEVGRRAR